MTESRFADRNKRIRNLYSRGLYTYAEVASLFSVSVRVVGCALDRQSRAEAKKNRRELAKGGGNVDILTQRAAYSIGVFNYREDLADRDALIAEMYTKGSKLGHLADTFGLSYAIIKTIIDKEPGSTYIVGARAAICKACGTAFTAIRSTHVYCSPACCATAKSFQGICPVCERTFNAKRRPVDQVYCSVACGRVARRRATIDRDLEIVSLKKKGFTRKELAAAYDLSESQIGTICSRKSYRGALIFAVRSKRELAAKRKAGTWESSRAKTSRLIASKREGSA